MPLTESWRALAWSGTYFEASATVELTRSSAALIAFSAGSLSLAQATSARLVSTITLRAHHRFSMAPPRRMWRGGRHARAQLGDAQLLADPDEGGIFHAVLVRLEDPHVEVAVAVVLLGDLPARFALLDLVPLRCIPRVLRFVGHAGPSVVVAAQTRGACGLDGHRDSPGRTRVRKSTGLCRWDFRLMPDGSRSPRHPDRLERPAPGTYTSSDRSLIMSRSEEHTSELQSLRHLVCRLLLEK